MVVSLQNMDSTVTAGSLKEQDEFTEDEEVARNCRSGKTGLQDSDLSSDDDDEDEDDCSEREKEEREDGVVEFVTNKLQKAGGGPPIFRPKPVVPRLSPTQEENNEDESSNSTSEDGPLSLGESNKEEGSRHSDRSAAATGSPEEEVSHAASDAAAEIGTIGCTADSDIKIQPQAPTAKSKRVLSSNTLAQLNKEAGHSNESPKKRRSSPNEEIEMSPPGFSLGRPAISTFGRLPNQFAMRGSPAYSTEDEDLDARLIEELSNQQISRGDDCADNTDKSPVPLLTPPQSPLTLEVGGDGNNGTSLCEWPSNLVIDSAMMTAATETRPLSPASLQDASDDDYFSADDFLGDDVKEPSSLTPLLKSIYVGTD